MCVVIILKQLGGSSWCFFFTVIIISLQSTNAMVYPQCIAKGSLQSSLHASASCRLHLPGPDERFVLPLQQNKNPLAILNTKIAQMMQLLSLTVHDRFSICVYSTRALQFTCSYNTPSMICIRTHMKHTHFCTRVSVCSSGPFFFRSHGEGPSCTPLASHPLPRCLPLVNLMPHATYVQQIIDQAY